MIKRYYYKTKDKRLFLIELSEWCEHNILSTRSYYMINKNNNLCVSITPMNIFNDKIPEEVIKYAKNLITEKLIPEDKNKIIELKPPFYYVPKN